jgi:hypothetical protein
VPRRRWFWDLCAVAFLLAVNLAVCWRLFKVDFTTQFGSIEGAFIGLERYLSRHWGDLSWFPLWHCGMPYQDTYVPLFHLVVAVLTSVGHISAGRAYHILVGVMYALGPVTLYWMAIRLGASRGAAFTSALCYSLLSPSTWLIANIRQDVGGWWYPRRLQVLTMYGEGPHVSALTILPLAILALQNLLGKKTGRALALAALAIGLMYVTNVPGTMSLGLAVFCWICAQPATKLRAAWTWAAVAALFAYAIVCYAVPPSSYLTVFGNTGGMHRGFSNSLKHGPILLAALLGAVAALGYLLARTRLPLLIRFAALSFVVTTVLAVTAHSETFELLPQAGRLHLEIEMGACLLMGAVVWLAYTWIPRWIRPVVLALCLAPVAYQLDHYRWRAHLDVQYANLPARSEYTTARWLDANMHGRRVFASGSTSFWLNAFTETPQLVGCCEQGQSMPVLNYVPFTITAGKDQQSAVLARNWLRALGVSAIVVNTQESTDDYKDFVAPARFESVLPILHREHGDAIYEVLPDRVSLAHVLRSGEEIRQAPPPFGDAALTRYAEIVVDAARPPAAIEWLNHETARIRPRLKKDDLVSVQIPWFSGWKAYVGGARRIVSRDGLGFMLLHPDCEGDCEILLRWTGPPDVWIAAVVSAAGLLAAGWLIVRAGRPYKGFGV